MEALKRYGEHEQESILARAKKKAKKANRPPKIRCPKCAWQPKKDSLWFCGRPVEGRRACGCAWNTFDTGGKCPLCGHQWEQTACLNCHQWSRHVDWYEKSSDSDT